LIKKALIITTAIIVIIIAIKFGVDHYNEFNNLKQNSDINAARLDKIEVSMDKLETSVNNVKTSINNLENDTFRRTIQPRINGFETEMYQFRSTNSTFQKRLEDFEYSVRKLTNITSQITSKLTKVEQQVNSQND
jgi:predicted  nucleic acid-binding Zn-ribbon protein